MRLKEFIKPIHNTIAKELALLEKDQEKLFRICKNTADALNEVRPLRGITKYPEWGTKLTIKYTYDRLDNHSLWESGYHEFLTKESKEFYFTVKGFYYLGAVCK